MANIPENTENPILRPVTRLETTTKVFGGEYIEGDEQQRGISNLQAIELAERDQYIMSRVGQAYVPASGDIPAEVGIASLDANGRLPKAQNTTGAVFTSDAQTLINKTVNKTDNTVTCTPTEISTTPYTLTPTKEMNAVLTASVALTLGDGPYIGYTLPVTAKAASTVTYAGANGTVTDNMDTDQTVNYIWKGTYWGSVSNATLPVFISTTQTVSPTMEMNYVVDSGGVVLTVDTGAYIGHRVSVTATSDTSVVYLGADGTTTQSIPADYRIVLTWNGSYWLSEIFAVVEGLDAQGNPFEYGGNLSIAAAPSTFTTVTTNGATLDPADDYRFILDINTSGAACSLDTGAYTFQHVDVININSNTVLLTYAAPGGNVTMSISQYKTARFTWNGSSWSAIVTEAMTGTNSHGENFQYDGTLTIEPRPESTADYSTEETLTGALWIDGKPIYRKVYTVSGGPWSDTSVQIPSGITSSITLIDAYGGLSGTDAGGTILMQYPLCRPSKYAITYQSDVYFREADNRFDVSFGSGLNINQIRLIVEYTKTTD